MVAQPAARTKYIAATHVRAAAVVERSAEIARFRKFVRRSTTGRSANARVVKDLVDAVKLARLDVNESNSFAVELSTFLLNFCRPVVLFACALTRLVFVRLAT